MGERLLATFRVTEDGDVHILPELATSPADMDMIGDMAVAIRDVFEDHQGPAGGEW